MAWKTQPFDVDGFDINNEFLNMAAGSGNYRPRLHESPGCLLWQILMP